ncbi:MAG: hypothetical protein HQM15_05405 [Deltaproteobacteria bacterium]|nr:hypothetical protein [Deltaproteobacteria bacterium]
MRKLLLLELMACVLAAIGALFSVTPAYAETCGPQPATFEVGNRFVTFGGAGSSGAPALAIIVSRLPIGSSNIVVATNPVESGPNVIFNGPVAIGQRINFPDYAGTFYVKVPGSGGQAAILVCHN